MSRGVLAMRLRLALLRQKIPVEMDRLLADSVYAAEVLLMCEYTEQTDLISLARQVVFSEREVPAAAAAPHGVPIASSRFHLGSSAGSEATAGAASQPAVSRPMPTTTGGRPTGPEDSLPPEPGDPDAPRNRRYLRGAR
jgi:hypothetical protein